MKIRSVNCKIRIIPYDSVDKAFNYPLPCNYTQQDIDRLEADADLEILDWYMLYDQLCKNPHHITDLLTCKKGGFLIDASTNMKYVFSQVELVPTEVEILEMLRRLKVFL
jgi:hypothetical protein